MILIFLLSLQVSADCDLTIGEDPSVGSEYRPIPFGYYHGARTGELLVYNRIRQFSSDRAPVSHPFSAESQSQGSIGGTLTLPDNVVGNINLNLEFGTQTQGTFDEMQSIVRGTHLRSINRGNITIPYKPTLEDLPFLPDLVSRAGNFAIVYSGWHDLDFSVFGSTSVFTESPHDEMLREWGLNFESDSSSSDGDDDDIIGGADDQGNPVVPTPVPTEPPGGWGVPGGTPGIPEEAHYDTIRQGWTIPEWDADGNFQIDGNGHVIGEYLSPDLPRPNDQRPPLVLPNIFPSFVMKVHAGNQHPGSGSGGGQAPQPQPQPTPPPPPPPPPDPSIPTRPPAPAESFPPGYTMPPPDNDYTPPEVELPTLPDFDSLLPPGDSSSSSPPMPEHEEVRGDQPLILRQDMANNISWVANYYIDSLIPGEWVSREPGRAGTGKWGTIYDGRKGMSDFTGERYELKVIPRPPVVLCEWTLRTFPHSQIPEGLTDFPDWAVPSFPLPIGRTGAEIIMQIVDHSRFPQVAPYFEMVRGMGGDKDTLYNAGVHSWTGLNSITDINGEPRDLGKEMIAWIRRNREILNLDEDVEAINQQPDWSTKHTMLPNRREFEILGRDILLVAEKLMIHNAFRPGSELEEFIANMEITIGEAGGSPSPQGNYGTSDPAWGQVNGVTDQILPANERLGASQHYAVKQIWAEPSNDIRMYQFIQMLYKAANRNIHEIYLFNNALRPENHTNPDGGLLAIGHTPLLQQLGSPHVFIREVDFFTDVYVSRTNFARYWDTAAMDGIIPPNGQAHSLRRFVEDLGEFEHQYTNVTEYRLGDGNRLTGIATSSVIGIPTEMFGHLRVDILDKHLTLAEMAVLMQRMMYLNGEPVINEKETIQLLSAYGAYLPYHLVGEQREAIEYLIVRGIIDPTQCEFTGAPTINFSTRNVTVDEVLTYLMRMADVDSRLIFRHVTIPFNADLVEAGFGVTRVNEEGNIGFESLMMEGQEGQITRETDILILIDANTQFRDPGGNLITAPPFFTYSPASTSFAPDIPTMRYIGIFSHAGERYWHFRHSFDISGNDERLSSQIALSANNSFLEYVENEENIESFKLANVIGKSDTEEEELNPDWWDDPDPDLDLTGGIRAEEEREPWLEFLDDSFAQVNTAVQFDNPGALLIPWNNHDVNILTGGVFTFSHAISPNSGRILYALLTNAFTFDDYFSSHPLVAAQFVDDNRRNTWVDSAEVIFLSNELEIGESVIARIENKEILKNMQYGRLGDVFSLVNSTQDSLPSFEWIPTSEDSIFGHLKVTYEIGVNAINTFRENISTNYGIGGQTWSTAYISDGDTLLVSFSYLRQKGILTEAIRFEHPSEDIREIYQFLGVNNNIYVFLGWNGDTNLNRVVSGNVITDFKNEHTPVVNFHEDEYFLDWRVVRGVTRDSLILRDFGGGHSLPPELPINVDNLNWINNPLTGLVDSMLGLDFSAQGIATSQPLYFPYDEDNSVGVLIQTPNIYSLLQNLEEEEQQDPPDASALNYQSDESTLSYMLLLEATNPFGNYIIHQHVENGGIINATLYVFKREDIWQGIQTATLPDMELIERSGMIMQENELVTAIDLNAFRQEQVSYREMRRSRNTIQTFVDGSDTKIIDLVNHGIPRFSIGDYGWQMHMNPFNRLPYNIDSDIEIWNFYNYLSHPVEWYPIPIFVSGQATPLSPFSGAYFTNFNINNSYRGGREFAWTNHALRWELPTLGYARMIDNETFIDINNSVNEAGLTEEGLPANQPLIKDILVSFTAPDDDDYFNPSRGITIIGAASRMYHSFLSLNAHSFQGESIRSNVYMVGSQRIRIGQSNTSTYISVDGRNFNNITTEDFDNSFRMIFDSGRIRLFSFEPNLVDVNFFHGQLDSVDMTDPDNWNISSSSTARRTFDFLEWESWKRIESLEDFITFAFIIVLNILPRILLFVLFAYSALTLIAKNPIVIKFCENVIDPYYYLSFKTRDVHQIKPTLVWITCFFGIVGLYLVQIGVGFNILGWFVQTILAFLST